MGGGLGKNVNMRIFLNFFQPQRLRLLKGEAQKSVWPSLTEKQSGDLRDSDPTHTYLYPPQDPSLGLRAVPPLIIPPEVLLLWDSMFLMRGPKRYGRIQRISRVMGAYLAGLVLRD